MKGSGRERQGLIMTITVECEGARIVIGVDQGPIRGTDSAKYVYYLLSDYHYYRQNLNFATDNAGNPENIEVSPSIEVSPLYSDEVPLVDGGQVSRWFHQDLMDRLFQFANVDEKERAWVSFCDSFNKRREKVRSWVGVLEHTERVISYPHGILEIVIDNHTCRLEGDEILRTTRFIEWYGHTFKAFIVMRGEEWAELMDHWFEMAEDGEVEMAGIQGMECVQDVLNYMRSNEDSISTTKEEMEENPKLPYLRNEELLLSNTVIRSKVENDGISMTKFASMMKPWLIGCSVPVWIGKEEQRFWRFDPSKVGIDVQQTLDSDTDGQETLEVEGNDEQ